jgi:hypothetical protein
MGFLAQLGVVVLTQSVARKPFHDKCNIKKPTKNKAFSLNLATFGLARRRRNLQLQSKRSCIALVFVVLVLSEAVLVLVIESR